MTVNGAGDRDHCADLRHQAAALVRAEFADPNRLDTDQKWTGADAPTER
jgi:hypothetical protein